ncbi:MAG: MacB family efflux pump subunit [Alphaproteobacteria bacterium]|nr:MacB family efflux pump subunit [Alphaproteobacteria bacterium]
MNENRAIADDFAVPSTASVHDRARVAGDAAPIISLRGLRREFASGDEIIVALDDLDLDIWRGEMVAIVGSSGSGKSTLMNVLGCLDQAFSGEYRFDGRDIRKYGVDELAELRREHFGFIFQRYQLLADLDAVENVELPAVYSGVRGGDRHRRARDLLTRLGLGDRMSHRPNALSGGQQQRVSVARALMNGGEVIFADEPTGALDSHTGAELLELLHQLNREGHTIIVVTHEKGLAESLPRQIELRDGAVVSDTRNTDAEYRELPQRHARLKRNWGVVDTVSRVFQAFAIAMRAMMSHKLRTFLTMLGIIIGIASVVSVVGLGQGSQEMVLNNIRSIGTNTINVFAGQGFRDRGGPRIETLVPADAEAIAQLASADSATPSVSANGTGLYRNISASVSMTGVGEQYFRVNGREFTAGVAFDEQSVSTYAQEVVIDETTRDTFFTNGENPLGQVILIGKLPLRVIGVVKSSTGFGPNANQLSVYAPYTTVMSRMLGQTYLQSITVRVADDASMDDAEAEIEALLTARHGTEDFTLMNTDTIRETIQSTTQTMTLFISAIALISLLVGGIGVMNIMLVSVTERTREIGVRLAIGARRGDILRQFLIEAVLVCIVGGGIGVALSLGISMLVPLFIAGLTVPFSAVTVAAAFASSTLIGVLFGFMPARSAARLDPVEALAFE